MARVKYTHKRSGRRVRRLMLQPSSSDEEVPASPVQVSLRTRRVRRLVIEPSSSEENVPASRAPEPAPMIGDPSLRRLWDPTPLRDPTEVPLVRFPPLVGSSTDGEVNHPQHLDLDAACFMMLTSDLPDLFGVMARPANRRVKVRDLPEFSDWLHVISDPIVVRVFAGSDVEQRNAFSAELVDKLRVVFGLTLTCSTDSSTLSRNQVNVSVSAMSQALGCLGARVCRVSFFGMKWRITEVEPVLDRFIQRYRVEMGSSVPLQKNLFDYGARFPSDGLLFFRFSDAQNKARRFREGTVHEMCNEEDYGSVDFRPVLDYRIRRVKMYQEVCHEILSVIQKQMLDQMPSTMRTVRTRLRQLQDLLERWRHMTPALRCSQLSGIRIETTIQTEMVIDGRRLCSEFDLFRIGGLERALGGPFDTRALSIESFMEFSELHVSGFAATVHGRQEHAPSVEIQSALTFARQAIGWSGRFMEGQLRHARDWALLAAEAEVHRFEGVQELGYSYHGVELDATEDRPFIHDFLEHAQWYLHSSVRDRTTPGLMLMAPHGRGYLPKTGIYVDRIGAARYYIDLYGADWRDHVRSIG